MPMDVGTSFVPHALLLLLLLLTKKWQIFTDLSQDREVFYAAFVHLH